MAGTRGYNFSTHVEGQSYLVLMRQLFAKSQDPNAPLIPIKEGTNVGRTDVTYFHPRRTVCGISRNQVSLNLLSNETIKCTNVCSYNCHL